MNYARKDGCKKHGLPLDLFEDDNVDDKQSVNKKFKIFNDTLDNFDDSQIFDKLPTTIRKKSVNSDEKPSLSKDKNVLNESVDLQPSQFFGSTQVMHQIDTILSENLTNDLEDIFNNKSREEIEQFFDKVEQSVNVLGEDNSIAVDQNVTKIVEAIFKSQSADSSIWNISTTQQEELHTTISNIDASFATALKQVLIANAKKNVNFHTETTIKGNAEVVRKSGDLGPFYGLPTKVKDLIKAYKGIDELYDWQDECLKLPAIKERKNLIYALPTSGGKTLVAEILVLREILCNKKNALFVLPFVAIVQEKVWGFSPFAVALDFLVEEYAASKGTYPPRKRRRKNSVYVATIEKALGLLNSLIECDRIDEIGLVVVDELHLIGDQGRGSTLEALLTKLMYIKADIQIVSMSATIGNIHELCRFLNAEMYSQDFRPIELKEYVKCENSIAQINYGKNNEHLLQMVRTVGSAKSSQSTLDPDSIGVLVQEVIPQDSCLVFCPTKKNCENVASLLCKVFKNRQDIIDHKAEQKVDLRNALRDESGLLCEILNLSIKYGIAYHHSGLLNEERKFIEEAFRNGILSVICCTSTLAAGVNLPARRVILRQPYVGISFITLSKYKQMVGRAGRAGLGETGDSILMCTKADLPKVQNLLTAPMDQALSSMHNGDGIGFRHLLLSCIGLGIANTRLKLFDVAKSTLLSFQNSRLEVDLKKLTDTAIVALFKLGAIQEASLAKPENNVNCDVTVKMNDSLMLNSTNDSTEIDTNLKKRKITLKNDTKFVISKLGCAAIKGGFELSKAHMLYDDLYQAQKSLVLLDCLHLLYLVTPYDVADQIRPNKTDYYNIYCQLGTNERQTAVVLGIDEAVASKMISNKKIKTVPERVLNRFFLALLLYDLWNGGSVFEVSNKFQVNRGIVQHLMTSAASFASNVVNFCETLDEFWTFAHLFQGMSQRLSHCCVRELMPLMELPSVKQSRARQLFNAGYKTIRSVAAANAEELVESIEHLPRRVANQMIAAAKMILLEKVENLREDAEDVLEGVEAKASVNQTIFS